MSEKMYYSSPLGGMLLTADDTGLQAVQFTDEPPEKAGKNVPGGNRALDILKQTAAWLDIYFSGKEPDFMPPLHMAGTDFQKVVWEKLRKIPYGKTTTYGAIAKEIEQESGRRMAAQAVGGAVGANPIAILVPCHRVIGTDGRLTGYLYGLDKKQALLAREGVRIS